LNSERTAGKGRGKLEPGGNAGNKGGDRGGEKKNERNFQRGGGREGKASTKKRALFFER